MPDTQSTAQILTPPVPSLLSTGYTTSADGSVIGVNSIDGIDVWQQNNSNISTTTGLGDMFVYGTSLNATTSQLNFTPIQEETFPSPDTLVDKGERVLDRLTSHQGRSTITVFRGDASKPSVKVIEFLVTQINQIEGEAYSTLKNNLGYTFYAMDHAPTMIQVSGHILNGADTALNRLGSQLSFTQGRVLDTGWLETFLENYSNAFSASVSQANNLRVFFAVKNRVAEVFIVGHSFSESSQFEGVVQFNMTMVVRRLMRKSNSKGAFPKPNPVAYSPSSSAPGNTETAPTVQSWNPDMPTWLNPPTEPISSTITTVDNSSVDHTAVVQQVQDAFSR